MTQPRAGWYPDPSDPSRQRYFDGTAWTENYANVGAAPPLPAQPANPGMSTGVKVLLVVGALIVAVIAFGSIGNSGKSSSPSSGTGGTTGSLYTTPTTTSSGFTPGQDNALAKAKLYLSMGGFSKQGLIQQLEMGDHFSTADATFAVQHLEATGDVDWNAEAVKKARQYLNMTGFSLDGLIQQLEDGDHFTPSQAQYGANAAYGR
jgi:hypothetical protein